MKKISKKKSAVPTSLFGDAGGDRIISVQGKKGIKYLSLVVYFPIRVFDRALVEEAIQKLPKQYLDELNSIFGKRFWNEFDGDQAVAIQNNLNILQNKIKGSPSHLAS